MEFKELEVGDIVRLGPGKQWADLEGQEYPITSITENGASSGRVIRVDNDKWPFTFVRRIGAGKLKSVPSYGDMVVLIKPDEKHKEPMPGRQFWSSDNEKYIGFVGTVCSMSGSGDYLVRLIYDNNGKQILEGRIWCRAEWLAPAIKNNSKSLPKVEKIPAPPKYAFANLKADDIVLLKLKRDKSKKIPVVVMEVYSSYATVISLNKEDNFSGFIDSSDEFHLTDKRSFERKFKVNDPVSLSKSIQSSASIEKDNRPAWGLWCEENLDLVGKVVGVAKRNFDKYDYFISFGRNHGWYREEWLVPFSDKKDKKIMNVEKINTKRASDLIVGDRIRIPEAGGDWHLAIRGRELSIAFKGVENKIPYIQFRLQSYEVNDTSYPFEYIGAAHQSKPLADTAESKSLSDITVSKNQVDENVRLRALLKKQIGDIANLRKQNNELRGKLEMKESEASDLKTILFKAYESWLEDKKFVLSQIMSEVGKMRR